MNIHGLFQEARMVFCESFSACIPEQHQGQMLRIVNVVDQLAQSPEGHLPFDRKSNANAGFIQQRKQCILVGLSFSVCVSAPAKLVAAAM
eukprot:1398724-Pyramimonas_sp.AAC.1